MKGADMIKGTFKRIFDNKNTFLNFSSFVLIVGAIVGLTAFSYFQMFAPRYSSFDKVFTTQDKNHVLVSYSSLFKSKNLSHQCVNNISFFMSHGLYGFKLRVYSNPIVSKTKDSFSDVISKVSLSYIQDHKKEFNEILNKKANDIINSCDPDQTEKREASVVVISDKKMVDKIVYGVVMSYDN